MQNFKIKTKQANVKWIFAIAFTLFFQLISFAQDPTDFGGGANPTDEPVLPVNGYVWVMMGIGIAFALYKHIILCNQNKTNCV